MLKRIGAVVLVLTCAGLLNGCAYITRASETQQGVSPQGESQNPDLSFDGRYVAFDSDAPLDPAEPDDSVTDVFVRDNQTANIVRISTADGDAGNGPSRNPSISDNGRFVAFESDASNLVPLDTNNVHRCLLARPRRRRRRHLRRARRGRDRCRERESGSRSATARARTRPSRATER